MTWWRTSGGDRVLRRVPDGRLPGLVEQLDRLYGQLDHDLGAAAQHLGIAVTRTSPD